MTDWHGRVLREKGKKLLSYDLMKHILCEEALRRRWESELFSHNCFFLNLLYSHFLFLTSSLAAKNTKRLFQNDTSRCIFDEISIVRLGRVPLVVLWLHIDLKAGELTMWLRLCTCRADVRISPTPAPPSALTHHFLVWLQFSQLAHNDGGWNCNSAENQLDARRD